MSTIFTHCTLSGKGRYRVHCMRARMMNTWTTYRDMDTYFKYSDFLVVMISVGLTSARPNKDTATILCCKQCTQWEIILTQPNHVHRD